MATDNEVMSLAIPVTGAQLLALSSAAYNDGQRALIEELVNGGVYVPPAVVAMFRRPARSAIEVIDEIRGGAK